MSDSLKQTVTSEQAAQQAYRDIVKMMEGHGYCVVTIRAGGRSLEQNGLYWTWMQEIADAVNERNHSDYSREEVHDKFKAMFLGFEPAKKIGSTELPKKLKSTSKMTMGEMFYYMQQVEHWAIDAGLALSHPDDNEYYRKKRQHDINGNGEQY